MTKETSRVFRFSGFVILSSFVIRLPRRSLAKAGHSSLRAKGAFTILELLVVISIIIVLAGLILATVGYVQKKGARSRAEAEIAAISAALESYKADNGIYPRDTANLTTDNLDPRTSTSPSSYQGASQFLYGEISGDRDYDGITDAGSKSYMSFKPMSLGRSDMANPPSASNKVTMIRDPFGYSYGYSTAYQSDPAKGYNPTFDLWSTANSANQAEWIKNW
jgi:type II secretory pathway pseudopilin PulG